MAKQANPLTGYVSQLSRHLSRSLRQSSEDSGAAPVHQARVATRRLGSVVDLVQPWLRKSRHRKIQERLRELRRRLAGIRDLDVMLGRLKQYRGEHAGAVRWLEEQLQEQRSKARKKLTRFRRTDQWRGAELAKALGKSRSRIGPALSKTIRRNFNHFSKSADALVKSGRHRRRRLTDVHELRISGKEIRYTLEFTAAIGARLPKQIGQRLKQIQDELGAWHDRVVLAQRAMKLAAKRELAMENSTLLGAVLKLVNVITADAAAEIEAFVASWRNVREQISTAVRELCSETLRKGTE
ncbi:MAG TPA: CHAD domain-containing protein [Tepidisphaeraceae bacterium]|nr:CHAD domain-containing protein [Tepidisphaeraceae bacterium]